MKKFEAEILLNTGRVESWISYTADDFTAEQLREEVQAELDAESIDSFRGQVIEVKEVK